MFAELINKTHLGGEGVVSESKKGRKSLLEGADWIN